MDVSTYNTKHFSTIIRKRLCGVLLFLLVFLAASTTVNLAVFEAVAGSLVVTDEIVNAVFRVDSDTGDRTIISQSGVAGAGPGFSGPFGIAVESDGFLI